MKQLKLILLVLGALFIACSTTPKVTPLTYRGTNLDGGQFGSTYPGVEGVDYLWPTTSDVDYFASKNMNTFRVGFQWERLQPTLKGPFAPAYFAKLDALVKYATSKGMNVFLNPHNFARYKVNGVDKLVGSPEVPNDAFADLWARLGAQYKGNPNVMASLVNEPHDMPTRQWVAAANAAILGIRSTGNKNVISVPGNAWTSAGTWSMSWLPDYDVANSVAMLEIVDPANNVVFEVHNYFDAAGGGEYKLDCASATAASEKLLNVTSWARTNKKKVFIGEFGAKTTPLCQSAVADMLTYVHANQDVYVGWLWWSGGSPWGTDYLLGLNPKNGVDNPRMAWLTPYLPAPSSVDSGPVVPPTPPAPTFLPVTYDSNGLFHLTSPQSTYVGYRPDTYNSLVPMSLFVWMHGCGGNAEGDVWSIAPPPTRATQSYIAISIGGREGGCWQTNTDAPKVLAAIEDVKKYFNINVNKIYLGGYSSGGDMTYRVGMEYSALFAGLLIENSDSLGAGASLASLMATASWKINIMQLNHTGDLTYPIATARKNLATLKSNGFNVVAIEKPGTHYDATVGETGTGYDLIHTLLPYLDVGWVSPSSSVDAGVSDSSVPVDSGKDVDAGKDATTVVDASVDASKDAGLVDASKDATVDAGVVVSPLKPVVRITYNWTTGYCEEIDLVNKTAQPLTWSAIRINLRGGTVRDQANVGPPWDTWGGTFSARTGVITVTPAAWQKLVAVTGKATIGYCGDFGPQKWTGTVVVDSIKP